MPCDYSQYPPNWREIRARILERAAHACEFCGVPNGASIVRGKLGSVPAYQDADGVIWAAHARIELCRASAGQYVESRAERNTRVVLTIAHLDHDKENWQVEDSRLAALCQRCHLGYDKARHVQNRKYGRAYKENQNDLFTE
jgi:hypothetical protein